MTLAQLAELIGDPEAAAELGTAPLGLETAPDGRLAVVTECPDCMEQHCCGYVANDGSVEEPAWVLVPLPGIAYPAVFLLQLACLLAAHEQCAVLPAGQRRH